MLGSYPSLNLHDPETYIAAVCSLLLCYPLWAGEAAIRKGTIESKYIPPTPGILEPILEDEVRAARYVDEWDRGARAQLALPPPQREKRLTMAELKAKYGPTWGIKSDRKAEPTREESRAALLAAIGQEAFDAIPEIGAEGWRTVGEKAIEVARRKAAE